LGPLDVDYHDIVSKASPVEAVPLPANHPHYILYTSGTTGMPKGVVRDTASWAVALKYSMTAFYDILPGETFWAASDIGWVVGHSYIVYAPLLNGSTTILYEGKPVGTPNAGALWRVIEEYGAKSVFLAPTAIRAIKQADPHAEFVKQHDVSSLKSLFLAGEHSDPDTLHWCEQALKQYNIAPVDHWWQTELGWPGVGNAIGLGRIPVRHGSCGLPVPGYDLKVLDDNGAVVPPGELGNLAIKLPLPPGTLLTLYNNEERYVRDYLTRYPGYYESGDAAFIDNDGYVHIMGRTDDVINTAGHRLSTGAMEEILMDHPDVADCAVIGVKDSLKGQVPIGFVITDVDCTKDETTICAELVQMVRDELGPVASFKKVAIVKALPKTRSGKILRGTMSKIANGQPYSIAPTIEDPKIFEWLAPEIVKLMNS
jgi:propionyl-CoA synthetase